MSVTATRRGYVVASLAVVAVAMAWLFGGRSLNAVVVPAVVLLVVAGVGLVRARTPEIRRELPKQAFAGSTVTVTLQPTVARPVAAVIRDSVPDGISGDAAFETVLDGAPLSYRVTLDERGVHEFGDVEVRLRDIFGLWERSVTVPASGQIVVFPRVYKLDADRGTLAGAVGITDERDQFDGLREYRAGDALRDVNWKASAKRGGDLVVTEYAGEGPDEEVTVVVDSATGDDADAVAEATASVCTHMLDAGLAVGLETPYESLSPSAGDEYRRQLLSVLARYDGGWQSNPSAGDVIVSATAAGVEIDFAGEARHSFDDVVARREEVAP